MHKRRVGRLSKLLSGVLLAILMGPACYAVQWVLGIPIPLFGVPYWFYRLMIDFSPLSCLGIIPISLVIALIQAVIWRNRRIAWLIVAASMFGSCIVTLFTAFIVFVTLLGMQKHHDTLRTEHHVYHLASEWKVGVGSASRAVFLLWQCNLPQTGCEIIYSEYIPPIYPEEEYESAAAELEWNPQTRAVEFILNGEVIYTHPE